MIKVIYMATPEIAVSALERLYSFPDVEVVGVVTMPDRPAGRGCKIKESPVKQTAVKLGIPVFQTPSISKDEDLKSKLKLMNADFFVTFAFGQLLSQEVIDIPKYCIINLHASLLPKYRGANPIQWAIVNGDKETGITTMKTVLKMDAGDICLSEKIMISDDMTMPELSFEISQKAPDLIYKTLKDIVSGELVPVLQDENQVSFAPKFKKEDGIVDFNITAEDFHNKVRGLQPWPMAYLCRNEKNIQIFDTEISDMPCENAKQGEIICINSLGITVRCADKAILIKNLKPESKSKMCACDFANGHRLKKGDIL